MTSSVRRIPKLHTSDLMENLKYPSVRIGSPAGKFSHQKSFPPGVVGGLWGGPLDREPRPDPGLVLVLLDQPGQAEVGDLDVVIVPDQTVPDDKIFNNEDEVISRLAVSGTSQLILK